MSGLTMTSIRRGAGCGTFDLNQPDNATSSPTADGDVSEGMVFGESESRGDFVSINVKDM